MRRAPDARPRSRLRAAGASRRPARPLKRTALLGAILEAALDCVIVIDEAGRIVEFNQAAEATFGWKRDEALGLSIAETIVPERLREAHNQGFRRFLATGERRVLGRRIEIEGRRRDGSLIPVELAITEVRLPGGRIFAAYLRDLSQRRAHEREIERQHEALHQKEKLAAMGSLLAGVAHELNNPLSIVVGQSLILGESTTDPATAARAAKIQAAAERCARVVKTFLDLARRREPVRRAVQLSAVVENVLELLAYGLRTAGVQIERDLADDLPALWADPDQLHQVVTNLVVNAQQALQERPAPRHLRLSTGLASDGRLRLTLADNGPGVPEAIRGRIFDPFFTTKPVGTGTGLGLSVCHGIVTLHGGRLTLKDTPGGGATFVVELPAEQPQEGPSAAAPLPEAPDAPAAGLALVIDDEPDIASMLAHVLGRQGLSVHVAPGGRAAQDLLLANAYDAVLCDLLMPDMDGPELFDWLVQHRPEQARRVVFVTGDTLGPAASRFLSRCGRPFIEKPFVLDDVRRAVRTLLAPA